MAVKMIDNLEEKLEAAYANHESSSSSTYEELKQSYNTLHEKNEYITAIMDKVYADLRNLIAESRGSMEMSNLDQKFIETEELEAKEDEVMEIQEILLHHKTVRSELQAKSNELEQSEQRLVSTREKLSIAVAKGKGLVVQRDNLKQSLSETSTELQRFSEVLNLKATRLQEVETKLKSYAEEGERVEALESLVVQNELLDKKIIELQELLGQEEQKTASVREKLNVAVRKGKALVQQRDSLKQTIEEMSAEVGRLKTESLSKHLVSWHEQVNTASNIIDTFFKSIGKGKDSEIADLGERIGLLHGACSSVLLEIESRKAELIGNNDFNSRQHQEEAFGEREDNSSMEDIKSMGNRLSSAVNELVVANAETLERKEKEMKIIIANLQRELHEKDI